MVSDNCVARCDGLMCVQLMRCYVALCVLNAHSLDIPAPIEMREIIRDTIVVSNTSSP